MATFVESSGPSAGGDDAAGGPPVPRGKPKALRPRRRISDQEQAVRASRVPRRPMGHVILDFRGLVLKIPVNSSSDYSEAETEYILAVEAYIHKTLRKFPTHREHLLIAQSLGYHK